MLLKKLIAGAGLVGALGATTPALADWYQPAPPVYVTPPAYGYGYGYGDRDDWRWRRHRMHEWREHQWREHEWREHHRRFW